MHADVRHLIETVDLGELPELAHHLVADHTTRTAALDNPTLPQHEISALLETAVSGTGKLSAGELTCIAKSQLDTEAIDRFIDKVRAGKPLQTLVEHQPLTGDQLTRIAGAGSHVKGKLVEALLRAGVTPDQLADAARRSKGVILLRWMAAASVSSLPDAEAAELVATLDEWMPSPKRGMGELLRQVLQRGGGVLDAAVDASSSTVRSVAAGMRQLTVEQAWKLAAITDDGDGIWSVTDGVDFDSQTYVWLGLVNNPMCPNDLLDALESAFTRGPQRPYKAIDSLRMRRAYKPDPVTVAFEDVTDEQQLAWIVKRAIKRTVDFPAVAANPHLTGQHIAELLQVADRWVSPPDAACSEAVTGLLDRLADESRELVTPHWYGRKTGEPVPVAQREVVSRHQALVRDALSRTEEVMDEERLAVIHARRLRYQPGVGPRMGLTLGDDVAAWTTLFDLLDGWDGPLGELVETVKALAVAA